MTALLRLVGWLLAIALVTLPVVALLNGWWGSERWPLTRMRVTGTFARVDPALLQSTLRPFARKGFFAVDLERAQRAVAALPWVEQAEVSKRWPDVMDVRVVEHRPFARWSRGRLLSDRGRLFPARDVQLPRDLPQLAGPDARVPEVVALYNESKALFAPIGIDVRRVELDARDSWTLALSNGVQVVVGRNEARARLARFARLMPQLLDRRMQPLKRADLRYTNGFALEWVDEKAMPANTDREPVERTAPQATATQASQRLGKTHTHSPLLPVIDAPSTVPHRITNHESRITASQA